MTKIYFVRHAKPDFSIKDDLIRPLCEEGVKACLKVTEFLQDKNIDVIFSSPYKRAIDTIKDFADKVNLEINVVDEFRERKIDDVWIEDFNSFARKQWSDFNYKLSNGESLGEVQERNIKAINKILEEHEGKNIIIGTHGTALSTIINYFNKNFNYDEFERIKPIMPLIVCIEFKGREAIKIEEFVIA